MGNTDRDSLVRAYKTEWTLRERFRETIVIIIKDILKSIDIKAIESRTKKEKDFLLKIDRQDKDYANPLADITDITGIRVVVEYKEEAQRAAKLLRESLYIDEQNSWSDRYGSTESNFGYSAIHIVACIPESLARQYLCQQISEKKFEIQIRTHLEHAWASKSRSLIYDKDIPKEYKRAFNRLAALLEIAEESFDILRTKISNLPTSAVQQPDTATTLTSDDIINLLSDIPPLSSIINILADTGLKVSDSARKEYTQAIAEVLMRQGARTKDEAEQLIADNATPIAKACILYMNATRMKSFPKDSLIVAGLAIVGNGDITPEQYSAGWHDRWRDGFLKASKELKEWREGNQI
jgi:ppGpp synthetase/RelA/SpoT-type nucleotidyltranferase